MPLYGVGYTIKDITLNKGIQTTFGSKNYENFVPSVDAEITIRMHNSGGILLGKTATLQFAVRPTTGGGLCPHARNPWNPNHTELDTAFRASRPDRSIVLPERISLKTLMAPALVSRMV